MGTARADMVCGDNGRALGQVLNVHFRPDRTLSRCRLRTYRFAAKQVNDRKALEVSGCLARPLVWLMRNENIN